MARAQSGRNNGVTMFKRQLHISGSAVGKGINRGGVKRTTSFPGYRGKKFGGSTPGNQFVKVRKGR